MNMATAIGKAFCRHEEQPQAGGQEQDDGQAGDDKARPLA
jgi:hypothetical protein